MASLRSYSKYSIEFLQYSRITWTWVCLLSFPPGNDALRATRDQISPWSSQSTSGRGVFHLHNSVDGTKCRSDPRCAAITATQTGHSSRIKSIADRLLLRRFATSPSRYSSNTNHVDLSARWKSSYEKDFGCYGRRSQAREPRRDNVPVLSSRVR